MEKEVNLPKVFCRKVGCTKKCLAFYDLIRNRNLTSKIKSPDQSLANTSVYLKFSEIKIK